MLTELLNNPNLLNDISAAVQHTTVDGAAAASSMSNSAAADYGTRRGYGSARPPAADTMNSRSHLPPTQQPPYTDAYSDNYATHNSVNPPSTAIHHRCY